MNTVSCLTNIQAKIKILTDSEAKVANYILEHYMDVLNYTVTELAEKVDVSVATVVRFCRSIGYKGYQDLKINLAQDAYVPYKQWNTSLEKNDTPSQITAKVIRSEIDILEETLYLLDMRKVENVAQTIKKANRVMLFGSGGSAIVAEDAMHKFLKAGVQCRAHMDAHLQLMESVLLEPGDVAFGISHSGTNHHVLECLKNAKDGGATIIGLTAYGKSPLHRLCDYTLMTSNKETIFESASVTARIAQLSIIDSLTAIISFMDYDHSYQTILKIRKATSGRKY